MQNGRTQAHDKGRIGGGRDETGPEPPGPRRRTGPPRSGEAGRADDRSHACRLVCVGPRYHHGRVSAAPTAARGAGATPPTGMRLPCLLSRVSGRSPGTTAGSLCGRPDPACTEPARTALPRAIPYRHCRDPSCPGRPGGADVGPPTGGYCGQPPCPERGQAHLRHGCKTDRVVRCTALRVGYRVVEIGCRKPSARGQAWLPQGKQTTGRPGAVQQLTKSKPPSTWATNPMPHASRSVAGGFL